MPPFNSALARPGIVAIIRSGQARIPVGECARCELVKPLRSRGLCWNCHRIITMVGELAEWGWTKAERISLYAHARLLGATVAEAATLAEVTERTGWRYEEELAAAGTAPWRATDPNIQRYARNRVSA